MMKLREEIRNAFGDYSEINGTSAAGLRYLNAVCLEALRIFVPLPLGLPRVVPRGGEFVDGNFIPEGVSVNLVFLLFGISLTVEQTIVSTNPFAASMSRANFDNPWEFKPERWLGMNESDQLEASQPFSFGPRACLGRG
jgi:cytochrome P450